MTQKNEEKLVQLLADMEEEEALALARQMLEDGFNPIRVLGLCREAMDIVGQRYEAQEYFLTELMLAGEMLTEISTMAKPLILDMDEDGEAAQSKGTVLIGTVHGDLHDIGKNIVTFMLEIDGYEVVDLGVDVPIREFISAIGEHRPSVVALSGFLTLAFDAMKETIEAFDADGIRNDFKIMIGGGQIDENIQKFTGADAFGRNAVEAVSLCNQWMAA
jgi:5-methyltetrahydrofolate--homocysteine methyltransferase